MKKKAYIFDIDGTLAKIGNRSPYDYTRVLEDTLIEPVYEVYKSLVDRGYAILIFTGRNIDCIDETKKWLTENFIVFDIFHCRGKTDRRPDYVLKKKMLEIYSEHYEIMGVFEDRQQCVDMYREQGLICFQVDKGDF